MIRASELLHRATDRLHEDLHGLVTRRLPGEGFEDRRRLVAQFVHSSRRALTQLLILLEWLRARRARTAGPLEDGAALVQAEAEQVCGFDRVDDLPGAESDPLARPTDRSPSRAD